MGITTGDFILLVVGSILFILALIVLMSNIMGQLYFFTLDPSKVVAQDISLRILSSMASPGKVDLKYSSPTENVIYHFSDFREIFCVEAESQITNIKTIDCSSNPFNVSLKAQSSSKFNLNITKFFNLTTEKPEIKAYWE